MAAILALSGLSAAAATWSGLSGVTNGWFDANNWTPAQVPGPGNSVMFTNAGSVAVQGQTNNVVGSNITVSNLAYTQMSNSVTVNFHTTAIDPGVTLTGDSPNLSTNQDVLLVGGTDLPKDTIIYTTIAGGTLAIGNLASPDTNKDLTVSARVLTANGGAHKATLDLSGLNKFTFGGGRFQVAGNGVSAALAGAQYAGQDRPMGSVLLAKTNVITAARPRTDQFPFAVSPFALMVNRYANSGGLATLVELGQENTINAEAITVGGARGGNTAATMRFRAGLVNPTLKLRNADGVSPVAEIEIGDNDIPNGATVQSIGIMDLSLGTADILVDTLTVGRGNGFQNLQAANGTGTLTLGAGTCEVTTLNIGCQAANNQSRATGTLTVRTNATIVAGTINIGNDEGDNSTGSGRGTLVIQGGTVRVSGNLVEEDAPGGIGVAGIAASTLTINSGGTLDMMPAGDTTRVM